MPVQEAVEYQGKRPIVRLMRILRKKKDKEWIPAKAESHMVRKKFRDKRYEQVNWELLGNGASHNQSFLNPVVNVAPYSFVVLWNGILVGEIFLSGGWFADHPDGANIEDFFKAIKGNVDEVV
jgi:hypothetical protein